MRELIHRGKEMLSSADFTNLVRLARLSLPGEDSKQFSAAQVEAMEKVMNTITVFPYGLFANAPIDSLVLLFACQGNEESLAGIPFSWKDRIKDLKEGEVVIANTLTGSFIKFDQQGNIEIEAKTDVTVNTTGNINLTAAQQITLTAPIIELNGDVSLGEGGNAIARSGDTVEVHNGPDTYTGTITSGGTNTST